jgi:hypothetical protein
LSEDGTRYYVWPVADERTLTLAMLLLVGLFAGAVCLELYRRRRDRALRLKAEWRGVKDFFDERGLLAEDWNLLRAILLQYAADCPFAAVTKRSHFDQCITRYFQALATSEDEAALNERGIRLREVRNQLGLDYVPLGRRIHTTRTLQPKQQLSISAAAGNPPAWFQFLIVDVNEANFSMTPAGKDDTVDLPAGCALKFRMWREEDARYLFESVLVRVDADSGRWIVTHADKMTRNQSRAYFRLRVEQAVTASVLNATRDENYEGIADQPAVTELRGRITSLSGGGLAVIFQQPVPKQVLLRIPLSIPSLGGTLDVIVRPIASQTLSGGRCHLRGMFVAMDDEMRESITRYVLSKQKLLTGADAADY